MIENREGVKHSEIRQLSHEEQAAFFINAKRLKQLFDGIRSNPANAKNVTDPSNTLNDVEKAMLIAAVEVAGVIDKAIADKEISEAQGDLLEKAVHIWIKNATQKAKN